MSKQKLEEAAKRQKLLRTTNDRKLWKAMFAHVIVGNDVDSYTPQMYLCAREYNERDLDWTYTQRFQIPSSYPQYPTNIQASNTCYFQAGGPLGVGHF